MASFRQALAHWKRNMKFYNIIFIPIIFSPIPLALQNNVKNKNNKDFLQVAKNRLLLGLIQTYNSLTFKVFKILSFKLKKAWKSSNLSAGSRENHLFEKIDFLRSTSNVFFLKAHIKISYQANFQNFWTLPHWLAKGQRQCENLIFALF
jgi:hypothetical protein